MTDQLIQRIKADLNTGTPGKWEVAYERGCTHLMMRDHPDMESQMCDETYYPWVPENDTDWHRIARVPDMESRILTDAKIIKAAEELADLVTELQGLLSDAREGQMVSYGDSILASYRAAVSEAKA